jgi:hypothetical protein
MIFTLGIAAFNIVISGLIAILPNASMPAMVNNAVSTISSYLSAVHGILPLTISTLITVLGLMVSFELGLFVYKQIMWVIHRIPTQGGGSPG